MRHYVTATLAAACLAFSVPVHASEDAQAWETINLTVALPGHFKLSNETVLRSGEARGLYELENNFMVGYQANPHVSAWLGYTHDPQYSHGDFTVLERRFRQQVNFDNVAKIGKASLSGRLRTEERWRDGLTGTAWRVRPAVKLSVPLAGTPTKLVLNHESFINLNTTVFQKQSGYERMRNSVAFNVPISKRFSLDLGYLNQHGFVRGGVDTSDHAVTTGLNATF